MCEAINTPVEHRIHSQTVPHPLLEFVANLQQ